MQWISSRTFTLVAYLSRLFLVIAGLFIMSTGIVCIYRSHMGLGPWDVLNQGISLNTSLTLGQSNIVISVLIILLDILLKMRPGVASFLNMGLVGIFIDLQLQLNWLPDLSQASLFIRLLIDILGIFLMGFGTAFYITQRLGAGPRDGLMLCLTTLTRARIAIVRTFLEGAALCIGFLLGGTVGIGTVLFLFGIGPSIEMSLWLVKKLGAVLKFFPARTSLL